MVLLISRSKTGKKKSSVLKIRIVANLEQAEGQWGGTVQTELGNNANGVGVLIFCSGVGGKGRRK